MSSASAPIVLYVVNDLVYFRAHRQALAAAVARQGCKVFVIAGNCTQSDERDTDPYILISHNIVRQAFRPFADFRFARFVRSWVKQNRPDIVHMVTIKPALFGTLGLVLPLQMKGARMVWTLPGLGKIYEGGGGLVHQLRRGLTTAGLSFAARRSRAHITVENSYDRDRLISQGIAAAKNVHVIDGTGLDLEHFKTAKKKYTAAPTFLMATRLLKAKGVDTYIAAARQLKVRKAEVRFLLAGLTDPINPDAYDQAQIEKAVEEGIIEWRGPVAQTDMPALLQECDVFCLPTRLQEGLPRSLMEAAACGCALIAPDQPSIRTFIIDEKTGWLLDHAGEAQLVEAMEKALADPARSRAMGQNAAEHIRSLAVSDDDVQKRFMALYGLEERQPCSP